MGSELPARILPLGAHWCIKTHAGPAHQIHQTQTRRPRVGWTPQSDTSGPIGRRNCLAREAAAAARGRRRIRRPSTAFSSRRPSFTSLRDCLLFLASQTLCRRRTPDPPGPDGCRDRVAVRRAARKQTRIPPTSIVIYY